MSKDTIYIDVEDDITAIIGKVKTSKHKIIALVPPKRVGVLQSAVNLRLLSRAAEQNDKRLVLITGSSALMALASSAGIPSARTLQSKPELAPLPEDGDEPGEDVIDGADLPVGDLARTDESGEASENLAKSAPAVDSAIRANATEEAAADPLPRPSKTKRNGIKVPNFGTFRRKLALGIGGLVLLIGFLVWAIWFAPQATIAITARTIESSANPSVALATDAETDAEAGTLRAMSYEITEEASLAFDATGDKEVGEKAEGQVVFQNCETDEVVSVPSGTGISAGGKTYITQSDATVPGAEGFAICTQAGQSSPVSVVAQEIGEDYNTESGTRFNVSGHSGSSSAFYFRAVADGDIDGGSSREITIVTKTDVTEAADQLTSKNSENAKKQLLEKFGEDAIAIESTFSADTSDVTSSPGVDGEAEDGKAELRGSITYTMLGVSKSEAGDFLDEYFNAEIEDSENQRVYENGVEKTTFLDVKDADNGYTATMTATAKFGPKIDDETVRSEAKGKRYGEVQSAIERISGVEAVDVQFSPFWVRTVPNDEERITIEFRLDESE